MAKGMYDRTGLDVNKDGSMFEVGGACNRTALSDARGEDIRSSEKRTAIGTICDSAVTVREGKGARKWEKETRRRQYVVNSPHMFLLPHSRHTVISMKKLRTLC